MPEITNKPQSLRSVAVDELLHAEALRQQYLKLMGIQVWFDPNLKMPILPVISNQNKIDEVSSPDVGSIESNLIKPDLIKTATQESLAEESNSELLNSNLSLTKENTALQTLESLAVNIAECELCELHINRQQAISGEGNADAKIFIIIDAPLLDTANENSLMNLAHKQMLHAMLEAIGCGLSSVFMTSLVKCLPPENRAPQTSEMICCDDHLSAQIKLINPDVIFVLGEQASQHLLVSQKSLTDLRLRDHKHLSIPVYASYHPANLFNSSETKRKVWADLLQIKHHLK